jgi:N-methylhydantoinase B
MDPILFQVIASALVEATEEMAIALKRSAYSTNIKTRNDFSCAFFDRRLRTVAQASGQPVHLGSLAESVPRVVRMYGEENLRAGDGILANDPYLGAVHLNDITLISPVYLGASLIGYVANLAHHVDVGGGAPGSIGAFREVFQEGVIVPGVKMVSQGKINDDVFRLVLAQIRSKRETAGDFRAQIAANVTGAKRVAALAERYGVEMLNAYIDELMGYTGRRARADLEKLPHGVFRAEGVVDNDGYTEEPVRLIAQVTINANGVEFDFAGSDPQRRAPVNSTHAQTFAACAYVLKCLIDPDVPVNAGFYGLVKMNAPLGSVTNCVAPAPVVGGWETQTRLTDIIFKALAQAVPERVPAGTKAMMAQVAFGGIDPRDGEMYAYYEAIAGGYGARMTRDGADAVQTHGQNTENAPAEESERGYPIRLTRYELVDDSDGAGKFRGGLGLRRDYQFIDHDASFTILSDRDRWGPHGLFGGKPGKVAQYFLLRDGQEIPLGSKTTIQLRAGDAVSFRSCGGGGYGDPFARDPLLVLRDVRDHKVSAGRARAEYGVVVDTMRWTVNEAETAQLRLGFR